MGKSLQTNRWADLFADLPADISAECKNLQVIWQISP
jgi:hypothetical protein